MLQCLKRHCTAWNCRPLGICISGRSDLSPGERRGWGRVGGERSMLDTDGWLTGSAATPCRVKTIRLYRNLTCRAAVQWNQVKSRSRDVILVGAVPSIPHPAPVVCALPVLNIRESSMDKRYVSTPTPTHTHQGAWTGDVAKGKVTGAFLSAIFVRVS